MRYYVYTVRGGKLHRTSTAFRQHDLALAKAWAQLLHEEPWMIADDQGIEVAWSDNWPVGDTNVIFVIHRR